MYMFWNSVDHSRSNLFIQRLTQVLVSIPKDKMNNFREELVRKSFHMSTKRDVVFCDIPTIIRLYFHSSTIF